MNKPDYRWNIASLDAYTHSAIYTNIHEAKYIAFGMPIYTTAYTLGHDNIILKTILEKYFLEKFQYIIQVIYQLGKKKCFRDYKIYKNTDHNLFVIKGIGTYIYDRDIHELVKNSNFRKFLQTFKYKKVLLDDFYKI